MLKTNKCMMKKICMITGATSGIGKSTAEVFARNKYDLIITGRRKTLLNELADFLLSEYGVKVLSLNFDVRDKKAVETALSEIAPEWEKIDILINNAGLALDLLPINEGNTDNWDVMIDTNIKGLLYVSRIIIPLMIKNGNGHIINIGSIAGKEAYINGNVYCATKSAVDSLSKSMRIDLLTKGIKVTQIIPGAVTTEFSFVRFKGDNEKARNAYKGFKPLNPEDVAGAIYYSASLPDHVNINEIVIMPTAQANTVHFDKREV